MVATSAPFLQLGAGGTSSSPNDYCVCVSDWLSNRTLRNFLLHFAEPNWGGVVKSTCLLGVLCLRHLSKTPDASWSCDDLAQLVDFIEREQRWPDELSAVVSHGVSGAGHRFPSPKKVFRKPPSSWREREAEQLKHRPQTRKEGGFAAPGTWSHAKFSRSSSAGAGRPNRDTSKIASSVYPPWGESPDQWVSKKVFEHDQHDYQCSEPYTGSRLPPQGEGEQYPAGEPELTIPQNESQTEKHAQWQPRASSDQFTGKDDGASKVPFPSASHSWQDPDSRKPVCKKAAATSRLESPSRKIAIDRKTNVSAGNVKDKLTEESKSQQAYRSAVEIADDFLKRNTLVEQFGEEPSSVNNMSADKTYHYMLDDDQQSVAPYQSTAQPRATEKATLGGWAATVPIRNGKPSLPLRETWPPPASGRGLDASDGEDSYWSGTDMPMHPAASAFLKQRLVETGPLGILSSSSAASSGSPRAHDSVEGFTLRRL